MRRPVSGLEVGAFYVLREATEPDALGDALPRLVGCFVGIETPGGRSFVRFNTLEGELLLPIDDEEWVAVGARA